jgi:hypothetical protein
MGWLPFLAGALLMALGAQLMLRDGNPLIVRAAGLACIVTGLLQCIFVDALVMP